MKTLDLDLIGDFQDKEYAHVFMNEILCAKIATQIKVLRSENNWTQARLAKEADLKQETISRMENVNYSAWTLSSLKKLAEAFDLALHVSFENFSTEINSIENIDEQSLKRISRKDDLKTLENTISENLCSPGIYASATEKETYSGLNQYGVNLRLLKLTSNFDPANQETKAA